MRNIATLVVLSLTTSLVVATATAHATNDSSPSSYVLDALDESKVVEKDIDELEDPSEFEEENAATPEASASETNPPQETLHENQRIEAELESTQNDVSESTSEHEASTPSQSAENSREPEGETVPGNDAALDNQETPEQHIEQPDTEEPESEERETEEPNTEERNTDEYTLLTDPLETEGFHVAGVTWEGATPEQIDVRAYTNGEWSEWFNLEIDVTGDGNDGTDPIMAAGSEGIQVRASGEVLPDSLDVHLMTGEGNAGTELESKPQEAEDQPALDTELEPAENVSATTKRDDQNFLLSGNNSDGPTATQLTSTHRAANLQSVPFSQNIVSRTQWGAPREATWKTQYASLQGAIVHHTDGSNSYTRAQAPGIVKGIWNYHTYTRGWGDIGYNFLIDRFGTVYEGRAGSTSAKAGEMAVGAHAAPANTGSVGVSVLGSYTGNTTPSNTVLDTISEVIAWQFAMADVDPAGRFTYRNSNGNNVTTNAISGHRDISATLCPGNIYSRLGTIRSSVASKLDRYRDRDPEFIRSERSGTGWPQDNAWSMGDFNGNGTTDLALRNSSGHLLLYRGRGDNTFSSPIQIGHGWNGFKKLYTGVDFDGDSVPDVLAINKTNQLFLYPGNGRGYFKKRQLIGHGWSFEHLIVFQNGPGQNPAIAGITGNGTMRLYPTDGQGGFLPRRDMGRGHTHLIGATAIGDWDHTGFSDVVSVSQSGRLHYYSDPTERGFTDPAQIGRGWAGLTLLPGDSVDGYHDLLTISPNGRLNTYIYAR